MNWANEGSVSLSGDPLTGEALVRHIYADEAGTSAEEPVSVVAAIIVHTDTQYLPVCGQMAHLIRKYVPQEYWPTFALHTKTLVRKEAYPNWDRNGPMGRYAFLREVMRIPANMGLPISIGAVRRGRDVLTPIAGIRPDQMDHVLAFALCIAAADAAIRRRCDNEMAVLVAEDHQEMKALLRGAVIALRSGQLKLQGDQVAAPTADPVSGLHTYKVERIVDAPHFMDRNGALLLQLADVCAYGFRRGLSNLPYGDSYINDLLGNGARPPNLLADWNYLHIVFYNLDEDGQHFYNAITGKPLLPAMGR
jgi:hypothetical protein